MDISLSPTDISESSIHENKYVPKSLEDIGDFNLPNKDYEIRELNLKLKRYEERVDELNSECQHKDTEIAKLESENEQLKQDLRLADFEDIEDLKVQLEHTQFLYKALQDKYQASQVKLYTFEKKEKNDYSDLKIKSQEFERDKNWLHEQIDILKEQLAYVTSERDMLKLKLNNKDEHEIKRRMEDREINSECNDQKIFIKSIEFVRKKVESNRDEFVIKRGKVKRSHSNKQNDFTTPSSSPCIKRIN